MKTILSTLAALLILGVVAPSASAHDWRYSRRYYHGHHYYYRPAYCVPAYYDYGYYPPYPVAYYPTPYYYPRYHRSHRVSVFFGFR
jgi:hypothetical protein